MGDASLEPGQRMKSLAEAASDFKVDNRIPIRRYFRSGQEMIKMAEVYRQEGNHEAAYVLYLKYMTLFVEKLKTHRDYNQILPSDKKKAMSKVREAMSITENLKKALKVRFEDEHQVWLQEEEVRRVERGRREAEERLRRQEIEAEIERDRQLAVRLDREEREGQSQPPQAASIPAQLSVQQPQYDPGRYSADTPTAPPPLYSDVPPLYSDLMGPSSPVYDRNTKPLPGPSPSSIITNATIPSMPDRSLKPSASSPAGLRTVNVPGDLISKFLEVAKVNSDRNIETLGTLGGQLCNNKFRVTHLLIPKQQGQSDSCTMDGIEDVWDIHDKENIIFLGWIHTHPAYSVFLSSVDMHNQYEWQHMLPEAIATVCSIKDSVTGHLRLTEAGMAEIGDCSLTNFHPHSTRPPLWTETDHVVTEAEVRVILKDLR